MHKQSSNFPSVETPTLEASFLACICDARDKYVGADFLTSDNPNSTWFSDLPRTRLDTFYVTSLNKKDLSFEFIRQTFVLYCCIPTWSSTENYSFCAYLLNALRENIPLVETLNRIWFKPRGLVLWVNPTIDYHAHSSCGRRTLALKTWQNLAKPALTTLALPIETNDPNDLEPFQYLVWCVEQAQTKYTAWYLSALQKKSISTTIVGFWNSHAEEGIARVEKLFIALQQTNDLDEGLKALVDYFCKDSFTQRTRANKHSFCSFFFNELARVHHDNTTNGHAFIRALNTLWFNPREIDLLQPLKHVDYTRKENQTGRLALFHAFKALDNPPGMIFKPSSWIPWRK